MNMTLTMRPGACRLVLAFIVVVSHYSILSGRYIGIPIDGPAVIGFFFLSGYWIKTLWNQKYRMAEHSVALFYISRAWRLYPLAIIATIWMGIISKAELKAILWNSTLLGLRLDSNTLNPPAWSLAIELQFYLIAPLIFLAIRSTIAFALISVLGVLSWLAFAGGMTGAYLSTFILPFVLGAFYAEHGIGNELLSKLVPFCLIAYLGLALLPALFGIVRFDEATPSRYVVIALSATTLPYIAACVTRQSDKLDRWLGDLAYPLYLFHWPAFLTAERLLPEHATLLAWALAWTVSLAINHLVDRPSERLRRKFVNRRSRRGTEEIAY